MEAFLVSDDSTEANKLIKNPVTWGDWAKSFDESLVQFRTGEKRSFSGIVV